MLIFDQLKKNDPQLRLLAMVVFGGLFVLLGGLWWVQIVNARDYQTNLETQSFRTVRLPSARGKILDRNGNVLAENRPTYNVSLYLEDLRHQFVSAYTNGAARVRAQRARQIADQEKQLHRGLTKREHKQYALNPADKNLIGQTTRFAVANDLVAQISARLRQPLSLDPTNFNRHYNTRLALPYPVLKNIDAVQVARFQEQFAGAIGTDLEIQSTRVYPLDTVAAHVLGYLRREDYPNVVGEDAYFSYRLPDYSGEVGIEAGYDMQLRGRAGAKSVLVNNLGYRQAENIWSPAEPGHNIVLTLDLQIQQAAERAMRGRLGPQACGAVVVMDVRNGDILAVASSPSVNPNDFVRGFTPAEMARLNDATLRPQINRATQENYAPGSIFKTITGLACLEAGLNPKETISSPGHIQIGRRYIHDTAPAGNYDFRRAMLKSSNTYFITNGLRCGIANIVTLGHRLHLGERAGLPTRQETPGVFPSLKDVSTGWFDGDTANICIGQGRMAVTPLQMAVMTSALANGGKVFWPRLVERLESQDPTAMEAPVIFAQARVRDELGVRARNLEILREAMLADTEDAEGTGRAAAVAGLRICAKTGTAQVTDERNHIVSHNLWFISFAPYEKPRYAVVVMAEGAGSGGGTCAPVAHDIYAAIQKLDTGTPATTLARGN
ncbi:MAG: penicillin-binding transpeptidase domain-containing protein [Verrucomicrobia bacterium]|jgi:penicillin-binding protein 2|nr:penicillin-binding transpeptidase domain-containing protein [Verrucomicrobiota bacterium]